MTDQVQKTATRRVRPPAVVHLSPAEHMEKGKVARAEVPRSSHAGFEPAATRPDPIDLLEEQAASRVAGAGADPIRADAGLTVRLLPGGGADHGLRSGRHTPLRSDRAGLR